MRRVQRLALAAAGGGLAWFAIPLTARADNCAELTDCYAYVMAAAAAIAALAALLLVISLWASIGTVGVGIVAAEGAAGAAGEAGAVATLVENLGAMLAEGKNIVPLLTSMAETAEGRSLLLAAQQAVAIAIAEYGGQMPRDVFQTFTTLLRYLGQFAGGG